MGVTNEQSYSNVLNIFQEVANQSLQFYPSLTKAHVELLNYSENATYLVRDFVNNEKYILRVNRPGYHTKEEIQSELLWLKSINLDSPIIVSLPFPGVNGEDVQEIILHENEPPYYCTLFSFLPGESPSEENEQELIEQFEILGEITAHLHEHSINWNPPQNVKRHTWTFETILGSNPTWGRWQDGKGMTPERIEMFQQVTEVIKQRLDQYGTSNEKFGLIHADLRLPNLIVEDKKIKVIDFDDCGFSWYLFDLASSLSFIEHQPYVPELIDAWVEGYRKVRPLSKQEEAEIPTFIMMRRLMLISWIGSHDNPTSQQLGSRYTEQTDELAIRYLEKYRL
ncbi:phosphotransferase enzyme family protein [Bacillus marasmi]|uniref:phosphotransferase enzyme family protein n=1 Tax=Bacillus marasmi TaxID=1926279 RepID=UPI0011CC39F5|nr:phosphotransferase [Bacillus marasmi]